MSHKKLTSPETLAEVAAREQLLLARSRMSRQERMLARMREKDAKSAARKR